MLEELKTQAKHRYVSPFYLAIVSMGLGDHNEADSQLEQGLEDRSNNMIFLNVLPQFDQLQSDARFQRLKHRMAL